MMNEQNPENGIKTLNKSVSDVFLMCCLAVLVVSVMFDVGFRIKWSKMVSFVCWLVVRYVGCGNNGEFNITYASLKL